MAVPFPLGCDPVSQRKPSEEDINCPKVVDVDGIPLPETLKGNPVDPPDGPQPSVGDPPGLLPIVNQPRLSKDWAGVIPNCLRGLEYLKAIDQLLVKQKVEIFEAITGFETNNRYSIQNALGQKVFYAVEETDCCTRNCCPERPFHIRIFEKYFEEEVIHLHRPLGCSSTCFPCCLHSIEISAPPGNVIGRIQEEWSICRPCFRILNQSGDVVLRIKGQVCFCHICGSIDFNIINLTGEKVGKISKQWSGLGRELYTDADIFRITFPMDMDVNLKAVLLGATFLIDFMFFEKSCEFLKYCICCLDT
ncbi:phospholipid scramblase 1-like [Drosophila eugracilis]|uniref:phospholipid scramblase 1-like n=1 Tax=Drosophila eugracilis TaxID=29029 RepID=UPI0007E88EA9|nr:phospholipid scramblase 1-like [Drosophila eugracilis]